MVNKGAYIDLEHRENVIAMLVTAVIVWASTAYNYINIGFSIGMEVFALYLIYYSVRHRRLPAISVDSLLKMSFFILYGALFISAFIVGDPKGIRGGYFSAVGFLLCTMPLWMMLYTGWDKNTTKAIFWTFWTIVSVMCLYGLYKYFHLTQTRLDSFYSFPTRIGIMMDLFIPFTAAFFFYFKKNRAIRYAASVLLILELPTLWFCRTRGALLSLAFAAVTVTILYFIFNWNKISAKVVLIMMLTVTAAATVSFIGYEQIKGNRSFLEQGGERIMMWESSYRMWDDHKLAGIGLNSWQKAYAEGPYHPAESREAGQVMPHNVVIYFFSTGGVISGIAFLIYGVLVFWYLLKEARRKKTDFFNWGVLLAYLAFMAHGMVDQSFILNLTGRIYYMLLGTAILYNRWRPENDPIEEQKSPPSSAL